MERSVKQESGQKLKKNMIKSELKKYEHLNLHRFEVGLFKKLYPNRKLNVIEKHYFYNAAYSLIAKGLAEVVTEDSTGLTVMLKRGANAFTR